MREVVAGVCMPHNTLTLPAAHAEKVVMNSSSGHAGRGDIQDDSIRQMFLDAYPRVVSKLDWAAAPHWLAVVVRLARQ